jgi:hypothetical protein
MFRPAVTVIGRSYRALAATHAEPATFSPLPEAKSGRKRHSHWLYFRTVFTARRIKELLILILQASIATRYGLDGPGIESWWGRDFPLTSRPALGPPSLLYYGYRVFPGDKSGRGVASSSKKEWRYTFTSLLGLRGLLQGELAFTLLQLCYEQTGQFTFHTGYWLYFLRGSRLHPSRSRVVRPTEMLVVDCWRFGTTYRYHLQVSRSAKINGLGPWEWDQCIVPKRK